MVAANQRADNRPVPSSTPFSPSLKLDPLEAWLKRAGSEIFSVTATITPEVAERLLARNAGNRPIREKGESRSVEAYARAMLRGEWVLNGAPIIVSADGQLNDGQHRLSAVVASGVAVPMHITFGVERESRHTVDQGAARSPGHILAMRGEKNYNTLATAVAVVWAYDGDKNFGTRPTPAQLIDCLDANPGIRDALHDAAHMKSGFLCSVGYIGGAHYLCRRVNAEHADDFLHAVRTGLNISDPKSAVFKLRKRLIDHTAKRENIPAIEQAALYIKAFNAVLHNRSPGNLLWRRFGPTAEDFPTAGA